MTKITRTTMFICTLFLILAGSSTVTSRPQVGIVDLYNLNEQKSSDNTNRSITCGYESCPRTDPNKLNVHIIAHTHDDVGWLKTVDQYYYGTRKIYSQAGVQFILDSLIPQLMMDPEKRFVYVEMSFFTKWWEEQDNQIRSIVRRLVNEGRLEFINGGWCMNDEATVNYQSTIEQMTLGLRFLNETFGSCGHPKVGWQIDPFGHTNEQASLFAQFGFDGMFFTRISYENKKQRIQNKSLDLIWHGDRALSGQTGSIFTNIFRDGYDAPMGFCFDALCQDDVMVDNKRSYEYNLEDMGQYMIHFIKNYARIKLTNHLLIPFGGDFQYSAAGQNFKSLDKLIKYIRRNASDIHIFYSTPSCYQYSVLQRVNEKKIKLPEKYDDFMPYDSSPTVWWSGFFTSRPSVKLIERETANLLQVARMISLSNLLRQQADISKKDWINEVKAHEAKCLLPLWEVLGDLQHHDAVTGTEKQHVANDYVRRASDAFGLCAKFIGELRRNRFNDLMRKSTKYDQLKESGKKYKLDPVYLEGTMFCPLLNISQCDALESDVDYKRYKLVSNNATNRSPPERVLFKPGSLPSELETKGVLITAYNSLSRPVSQVDIRLPCNGRCDLDKVQVIHVATNESMKLIRLSVPSGVATLPFRDARTSYEILFYANIPALGSTSFVISDDNPDDLVDEEVHPNDSILITDETPSNRNEVRNRRIRSQKSSEYSNEKYEYFSMVDDHNQEHKRKQRDLSQQGASDRVIVKFDMSAGVIVGLKRASDGSSLNITQKFGYYYPANSGEPPGAYIFRPNTSSPILLNKPINFRMLKRQNGALIEIHQKWADWIWQTVRVDAKKNYIEFDYVVGPIPSTLRTGREVITRYITSMANDGVFFTDSNGRQLLPRSKLRRSEPEQLGGSFFPVVSTMMIRNNMHRSNKSAEAVAVLVDRAQAGTSLNEGDLEFLIHRRHLRDDKFGVGEPLDEPGEDGCGLVTRGRHRLYLKFQSHKDSEMLESGTKLKSRPKFFKMAKTPRANESFEEQIANGVGELPPQGGTSTDTYIVHDQLLNDLKLESIKYALKPILTFDRLRVRANEFIDMLATDGTTKIKTDLTLLNTTLPSNIHLVTLQPWGAKSNELLIRLENLDNPLTLHPLPNYKMYLSLLQSYKASGQQIVADKDDPCMERRNPRVEVDIEYLIKKIRIVSLEELSLGANVRLKDVKRLDWTNEEPVANDCESSDRPTSIKLAPRQIRTFLATFQYL